ncbi:hypothetical protein HB847_14965 [Listeria booriae]|uniref:Uncharacterized protein n=1 Tax=Listeria booriae TaxID=1552123 RepID=A0A841Y9Q5_9LIST|nr:hypothetical protein [Listeria booriae]MBC1373653.1 hypothetical protein [Listeria booriae]
MSEEVTAQVNAAIHGAGLLLQIEGYPHEEQAAHRYHKDIPFGTDYG